MPQISGELLFPPDVPDFTGARVTFRIEDTGMQDVSAAVHHEEVMQDMAYAPRVAFNMNVPEARSQTLTLSVHVDIDHSGSITRGDFITTQAFPVLRDGDRFAILSVPLEQV